MKLNNILSILTLGGALATANIAHADPSRVRVYDHRTNWRNADNQQRNADDVIGTARLTEGRGVAAFRVTPQMRRDGLALRTDAQNVRILAVDFQYSDGRVVRLSGRQLRPSGDGLIQIQSGRPPGLRGVRVIYASRFQQQYDQYGYGAYDQQPDLGMLQLVQIHTGDGYTHEGDLWQNRDPDGDGDDEVDGAQTVNPPE